MSCLLFSYSFIPFHLSTVLEHAAHWAHSAQTSNETTFNYFLCCTTQSRDFSYSNTTSSKFYANDKWSSQTTPITWNDFPVQFYHRYGLPFFTSSLAALVPILLFDWEKELRILSYPVIHELSLKKYRAITKTNKALPEIAGASGDDTQLVLLNR